MKPEFLHDVSSVGFHRFDTDPKHLGDLFVGLAFGYQFNDLALARREPARRRICLRANDTAEIATQHHFRYPGSEEELLLAERLQRRDQVVARIALESVPPGARAEDLVYEVSLRNIANRIFLAAA